MAAYSKAQCEEICRKYQPAIWKHVKHYHHDCFPMISDEDLFQDGMEVLLIHLDKSLNTGEFVFPTFDIKARMMRSLHDSLPVAYGHTKKNYVKHIQEAPSTICSVDRANDDPSTFENADYKIDFDNFRSVLTDQERALLDFVAAGYTWGEAIQMMGLARSTGYYLRSQIKTKYNKMMR